MPGGGPKYRPATAAPGATAVFLGSSRLGQDTANLYERFAGGQQLQGGG
jgi:hypothetical protein